MNQTKLNYLHLIWIGWFAAYIFLVPMFTEGTSFLAAPVDWALPEWFKYVFLNVPLQLLVVVAALVLLKRSAPGQPSGPAVWTSVIATLLITVNFAVAVWGHFFG